MAFLNDVIFPAGILYGSDSGPMYRTDVVTLGNGSESRNQKWAYPLHVFNTGIIEKAADFEALLATFHVAAGRANGFRLLHNYDYKSCSMTATESALDQAIGTGDGSTLAFQLLKNYTVGVTTQQRKITRPIAGTELCAISGVEQTTRFSVDDETGILTFDADLQRTVTSASSITPGITEIITSAHSLNDGDTVYLTTFTGDWAALNGTRFVVDVTTATRYRINFDSSAFTAYSSNAGQHNTIPQTGEAVTAGYQFHIPVRFDADQMPTTWIAYQMGEVSIPIVELRE